MNDLMQFQNWGRDGSASPLEVDGTASPALGDRPASARLLKFICSVRASP